MIRILIGLVAVGLGVAGRPANGAAPDLTPGTTVSGRVLAEPGGKPVAGVVVTLWNGSGSGRWAARTDEKGAYSFSDIKPGDYYKVWIEARPGRVAEVWSEAVVVRVASLPVKADDLFATLPQSLSGTVTDADTGKPVRGAGINFSTADGNRQVVETDSEGRYRLFVTPREVSLYCYGTAERYDPPEVQRRVTVNEGKHVKDIDFKLKSAPPFSGLVVYPDGKPARGAQVLVTVRRPPLPVGGMGDLGSHKEYRLTTDTKGRFVGYMLGVRKSPTVDLKVVARPLDHGAGGVVEGKTTAQDNYRVEPLKVVLARSAGILVRVVDPDGAPVRNSEVGASTYPWQDRSGLGGAVKHVGDGNYLIMGLIPGLDYRVWVNNTPGLRATMYPGTITLKPDETRELEDLRLDWRGKKAIPGLLKKLQSPDMYDRELAVNLLAELGADAAEAVPALVEKLKSDPRNTVRYSAATALGRIGPGARGAVPDLIKALQKDTGGGVQREAATALGLLGEPSALPALKVASIHADIDVRRAAGEAIKRLDEAAKKRPISP